MKPRDLCLAASKRPEGVSATEMAPMPRSTACMNFRNLCDAGEVYRAGGHMETRYFDNPEAAKAFVAAMRVSRAPAKRAYVAMGNTRKRITKAGWGPDDPAVITSETKVTIAPAPVRSLYTNTFPRY